MTTDNKTLAVDVLATMDDVSRNHDNGSFSFDELREARAAVADLIERAENLLGVIHGVGADFRNGVTDSTGTIDEGEVYGWRAVSEMEQMIARVKGESA